MDILQTVIILFIIRAEHAEGSAKVCSFTQEPHPSRGHQLQWVMASSKEERCLCTVILPGGVNTMVPKRSYEVYHTDQPLFTDDVEMIHDYFDCHDESMTTTIKTIEHTDCQAWFDAGSTSSAAYNISMQSHTGRKEVYCEMEDGEGWLVFQRRQDGSVNFNRNWLEYKEGFGDLSSEFWLGNEALQLLTSVKDGSNWMIRVDLTDENGQQMSLMTSPFSITGDEYALNIGSPGIEPTVNGKCCQYLGMEDYTIPDSSITASGVYQRELTYCFEGNGRLNQVSGSWCPNEETAWFQVDLQIQTQVEGVIMQGSYYEPDKEWVTKYKVEYSSHQRTWYYVGGISLDTAQESDGNTDHDTPVTSMFEEPVQARYIRIIPTKYNKWPSMRIELIGCKGGVLESLNGRKFSTYDNDNDNDVQNCAGLVKAGWWFDVCAVESNLNGEYSHGVEDLGQEYRGIRWFTWPGRQIVKTEMKMRRNN